MRPRLALESWRGREPHDLTKSVDCAGSPRGAAEHPALGRRACRALYLVNFRYVIRCGRLAASPSCCLRHSSYSEKLPSKKTYALAGPAGSGMICVNGAAAHLVHKGDLVILCAYSQMEPAEAEVFEPTVVLVDEANRIAQVSKYRAGLLVGTA